MQTIVTHSGHFHADDCFAVATLLLYLSGQEVKIIRTRDPRLFEIGNFVVDVGRVYNPAENKFDHHQEGWNEKRENGVPYAAFGLVWKKFGAELTSLEIAKILDRKIVSPIDADDNGVSFASYSISNWSEYRLSSAIRSFNSTWQEKENNDQNFLIAVEFAQKILAREIKHAGASVEAVKAFRQAYHEAEDKRIVVLDVDSSGWKEGIEEFPEVLFVISPYDNHWSVRAVKKGVGFDTRKNLPASWAGKEGEDLAKVSGVPDAIFCHNKLFVANAKSKEGAIALAKLALI